MSTKKLFLITVMVVASALAPHALAADGFTALAPIPGLTDQSATSVVNASTLANFFNNLYKYLVGMAAILAVIEIIWGGLEYSTQDSVSKQSDGKERIYGAIMGLILVLSPVLVFSIINPSILNLSLNLPEIKSVASQEKPSEDTPVPLLELQKTCGQYHSVVSVRSPAICGDGSPGKRIKIPIECCLSNIKDASITCCGLPN